ncbi:O-antigen ligase family protein [Tsuneonella suprasediminis]|uniref:O-antigen ligase family protein n=1 Tax=Tsuneonella suprasediminis TaxID=2306996 RepID=UPI002F920AC2
MTGPSNKIRPILRPIAMLALVVCFLLLGGKDAQFLGWQLPLLQLMAATAFGLIFLPPRYGAPAGIGGALAALGLIVLQLVPLPPGLLTQSQPPLIGEIRAYAGHNGWVASTTDLYATFGFLAFALLGATLYVIFRNTGRTVIIHCLHATVIVALASLTVAAIQISSSGSTFDFWNSPHVLNGPGFFANRNHQALFLGLASATVWWLARLRGGRSSRNPDKTRGIALFCSLAFLLGAVGTASRAGIVLAVGSTILAIALFQRPSRRIGITPISIAAVIFAPGLAALAIFNDTVAGALSRFKAIDVDARWQLWANSWVAAKEFFPLGSGYGTFIPVYAMAEPIDQLTPAYANHAHNEYLELCLEGGLPFVIGFVLFLAVFAKRLTAIFRRQDSPPSLALLGTLWTIAFLLHSLVDYPVRTPSLLALFAMGLAMTFAERGEQAAHGSPPHPRTENR